MAHQHPAPARASFAEVLIDESPDALIALTLDGRVRSWNRGAEVMFGYPASEAIGRPVDELIVPEDRRAEASRIFEDAVRKEPAVLETIRRRKDGSLVHVDVSMRLVDVPGIEPFVAVNKKDVGQLKRLRDQHAIDRKFRGLLEATPDAIVIVSQDGKIVIVNAQTERLFAYTRDELLGQFVELLVPARFRPLHPSLREGYFASPQPRALGAGMELFGVRKDGSEFPIEISLSPLHTEEGTLVSSAIRDITARKRLEWRIREASRLKGEFLANMSHELRTPLNAIIGFAELMYKGKVGPVSPQHEEYLGDILSSSRHLLQLINDILDLAKVESGKMEFRPETVDMSGLLGEVRDVVRGLAASKRLQMVTFVDPEVNAVFVDPARVKQILYNYISNAIKFTPEDGRIDVRIIPEGPELFRIDVEDTGVGISADQLSALFVEFQQLDASAAKKYQGTGLGLALTKQLAEGHGGRISVRSTPGKGSLFSAILPRVMTVIDIGTDDARDMG